jgi:uncharacterized cupin superfamily protein
MSLFTSSMLLASAFAVSLPTARAAAPPTATPTAPVHAKLADLAWVDLPEFGGREAIIYRSPDGKRVAAAFHESGRATFTYPFDEFLVVTSGTATVHVHGGETFTMAAGEVGYFREGTTVDFDFSPDFADITCLMSEHEVRWR